MPESTADATCPSEVELRRFVAGALSSVAAEALQEHVASCRTCPQRLKELQTGSWSSVVETLDAQLATPAGPARPRTNLLGEELMTGTRVGRYLILDRLGAGAMGVVYAAYDPELDRRVAIKLLRSTPSMETAPQARARLLREAHAMAKLSHPNVVAVYDAGTLDQRVFIAMELVQGKTLRAWLKEAPRSWREVVSAFVAAGRGLAAAHAAGLVHRDFKPDNVLRGDDGRVRVTDFGLVRAASMADPTEPVATPSGEPVLPTGALSNTTSSALSTPLTVADVVVGTPGYMAPEQYFQAQVDARTDQFNFCISLYEGLYGERPFEGWSMEELALATVNGRVREEPKAARVPRFLRRVLLRGLQVKPADRYPSMEALLADLAKDPSVLRRRALAAVGALAVLATGAALAVRAERQHDQLCKGAEQKLIDVWDGPTQSRIQRAFQATGKPYADGVFAATRAALDSYASGWVTMRTEACEATRLRGDQPEAVMGLRMACLDERLRSMAALTRLFAEPDEDVVQRAVDAANALPPILSCADIAALSAPVRPPDEPGLRARVEALRGKLAEVRALSAAGKYKLGIERATPLAEEAKQIGYLPLQAEALNMLGGLQERIGDHVQAEKTTFDALMAARAGRHEEAEATAAVELYRTVGYSLAREEEGERWYRFAEASLARLGGNLEVEKKLLWNKAIILNEKGKSAEALPLFEKVLQKQRERFGEDHSGNAKVYTMIAGCLADQGRIDDAFAAYRRALALEEKHLGASHPEVGMTLNNLGILYSDQHREDEALAAFKRAIDIWAAVSPNHSFRATTLSNLGRSLMHLKRYREAADSLEQALAVYEKTLAKDHPWLVPTLNNLGETRLELGDRAGAIATLERALRIGATHTTRPEELSWARFNIARALWEKKADRPRAIRLATQAVEKLPEPELTRAKAWLASHRAR